MSLFRLAAGCAVALALVGAARAEPLRTPHVETELVSSRSTVAPGERFTVAVRQRIIPGWHTYWRNPGDSGEPIVVTWRLPPGFAAGELRHPPPHTEQVLNVMTYVHKGEVLFPIELRAPENLRPGASIALNAHVFYLVCSDICLTEEGDVSASLPVGAASQPDAVWAQPIAAAEASIPRNEGSEARITTGQPAQLTVASERLATAGREGRLRSLGFFPFSPDEVRHVVPQRPSYGQNGVSFSLAPGVRNNLGQAELAGIIAFDEKTGNGWVRRGVEIVAKPGAALHGAGGTPLPDAARPTSPGAGEASASGGDITLPLALLFAFLGGLILNVMPCVLPVLAIKAVGFAQNAHGSARRGGLFYFAGVLATFLALAGLLVALRSAGGAFGWAFQLQEPWLVSALALLFFAIGLNLLGAFEIGGAANLGSSLAARGGDAGAFFTGALAVIVASPCTAPFMASATGFALASSPAVGFAIFAALAVGFALPLTLLSFAPGLQKLIPRPGAWMERFRQFLAFPMFGAAVWLAWVLTVQQGAMGAVALLSVAVALSFVLVAWRWGRIWGAIALAALAAVAFFAVRPLTAPAQAATAPSASAELLGEPWSSERVEALRAENRPILINFTAAWCVTCKVNEASSLRSARVAQAFRESNVAYLKGDWTSRDSAIAAELQRHGRAGVPLYLYYAPGAETPRVLPQLLTESLLLQMVEPRT